MPFRQRESTINPIIPHLVFSLIGEAALLKQPVSVCRAAFKSLRQANATALNR